MNFQAHDVGLFHSRHRISGNNGVRKGIDPKHPLSEIRSFDVFDTCLTRRVGAPTDLFREVARRVLLERGVTPDRPRIEDFVAARIEAESAVRKGTSSEDITLTQIWSALGASMGWASEESLLRHELDVEAESLVAVAATRSLIGKLRTEGYRIIFVSDMYLPTAFIGGLLERHGFIREGDGLYVSGEIGKMKSSGNLFRHVLDSEKAPPSRIVHHGDDRHSDYLVPRGMGIRAELLTEGRLTGAEHDLLRMSRETESASRLAGGMKSFRAASNAHDANETALVSQFIGPFVMGFAAWVLRQAREAGIKRLYFLSRDCQMAWKVARELAPHYGDIDCRYLHVSRQALHLPSATDLSPEGMPWMRRRFEKPVLKDLLAKLELNYGELASSFVGLAGAQGESFRLESGEDWKHFWSGINSPPVREVLLQLIESRRKKALLYFESQGLLDDCPWAVVDLGWYLSGQRSLSHILKHSGRRVPVRGIYLALKQGRCSPAEAGLSEALIYENHPGMDHASSGSPVFEYQTLIEHIIGLADHPSVHHYEVGDGGAGAVFAGPLDLRARDFALGIHDKAVDFALKNHDLLDDFKNPGFCRESLSLLADTFFKRPAEPCARALLPLTVANDQNESDSMPLLRELDLAKACSALDAGSGFYPPETIGCFWREGALAITPRSRVRLAALLTRVVGRFRRTRNGIRRRLAMSAGFR